MIVELHGIFGILFEEVEKVEVCFESVLEGCVGAVARVAVAGFLKVRRKSQDAGGDTPGPD